MYPVTERTLDPILTLLPYDIRKTRIGPSVARSAGAKTPTDPACHMHFGM